MEHCCHINLRNVRHCASLGSGGAVVEVGSRYHAVERLHSSGLVDIDVRVADGHMYLDAEYLRRAVVAGTDMAAVVRWQERRKKAVEN